MQWSHMLGVAEPHRGTGLGRLLKIEQRRRTLAMGLDLIEWTYDPLQALNAHFNFVKLAVVVEEYEENVYGESSSVLHRGTPTDRFVARWWIRDPRVERRLETDASPSSHEIEAGGLRSVNRVRCPRPLARTGSGRSLPLGSPSARHDPGGIHGDAGAGR